MGPSFGSGLVLAGAVVLLVLVTTPVLGEAEEGTVRLGPGETVYVTIDNTGWEDLWLEYQVSVHDGPAVNVWFTGEEGYTEFYDPHETSFSYYPEHSVEETSHVEKDFSWDNEGIFYLIVDNRHNVGNDHNVTVEYNVTWESHEFDGFFLVSLIAIIVVIMIVVVLLVVMMTFRKAQLVEEARKEEARKEGERDGSGRPRPPEPYPEWVVAASMRDLAEDDATGWDPSRDEPED